MEDKFNALREAYEAVSASLAIIVAAGAGRLMYHSAEVKAKRRKFFGYELLWETPIAFGMAIIGNGFSEYFVLGEKSALAVVAAFAYLGPRGAEAILERTLGTKR